MTLKDLLLLAQSEINVYTPGDEPDSGKLFQCLDVFMLMTDMWEADDLTIQEVKMAEYDLTANTQTYSIGVGGDWDGFRPQTIIRAGFVNTFVNPTTPLETPIRVLTDIEWASVPQKALTSNISWALWYDMRFDTDDTGLIWLYPVPLTPAKVRLYVPTPLTYPARTLAGLDAELHTPPGYKMALMKNLAKQICGIFERTPSPTLVDDARNSLNLVRRSNVKDLKANLPAELLNRKTIRRRNYNILTNQ